MISGIWYICFGCCAPLTVLDSTIHMHVNVGWAALRITLSTDIFFERPTVGALITLRADIFFERPTVGALVTLRTDICVERPTVGARIMLRTDI